MCRSRRAPDRDTRIRQGPRKSSSRGLHSFLRHSGFAQAGEKGVLEQGANLWCAETSDSLQSSDAEITAVVAQRPRMRELRGVTRGEPSDRPGATM
jgi:hypothetical protein